MKEYQNLIGKFAIAIAIIVAGIMLSDAIGEAGAQIAGRLSTLASQLN